MRNFLLILFLVLSATVYSQDISQNIIDEIVAKEYFPISLSQDSSEIETVQLLPNSYPITQKLLWSEKGLMRNFNGFELNEQNRLREVKWRNNMLKAHKILGYAAIVGMAGMAYTGVKLYEGDRSYNGLHEGFATFTYATYFTSGGLILFAPPWQTDRAQGYSNIKLHKYLSFLHMGLMATAIATADGADKKGFVRDLHRASAFGAFGTYFVSTLIVEF